MLPALSLRNPSALKTFKTFTAAPPIIWVFRERFGRCVPYRLDPISLVWNKGIWVITLWVTVSSVALLFCGCTFPQYISHTNNRSPRFLPVFSLLDVFRFILRFILHNSLHNPVPSLCCHPAPLLAGSRSPSRRCSSLTPDRTGLCDVRTGKGLLLLHSTRQDEKTHTKHISECWACGPGFHRAEAQSLTNCSAKQLRHCFPHFHSCKTAQ